MPAPATRPPADPPGGAGPTAPLLEAQARVLELIVQGSPLPDVLAALCRIAEAQADRPARAAILLVAAGGTRLVTGAAPSLPDEFNRAVDGVAIAPGGGTCCAAAACREVVVTPDIAAAPGWVGLAHLPLGLGLKAAWSMPIVSAGGAVLGTFGTYFPETRGPTPDERRLVEVLARTAALAVERGRADERLRASEGRLRSVFEAMNEGFCLVEPVRDAAGRAVDYRYLMANPALGHHTGLTDVVGRTAREVMPNHETHWIEAYGRVAATGETFRAEGRVEDLGRWFEVSAFRVGDPAVGHVGVLFSDASDRHRAEEAVKANERQLADVFRHAPSFMAVLRGPDHVFERVNDRYSRLVAGREVVGRPLREALPEVAGQGFVELLDRVYRTGEPFIGEGTRVLLDPGGGRPHEERFLDFVYQPLRDPGGAVTGVLVQGVDLTDRRRAEEALRDADRRKDEFLAVLAHELRNPLAPLRTGLQVLRLAGPGAEAADRARAMMDRQLAHLVRLVDDLLDVSRVSRGKMALRRGRVSLAEVIAHAVETARPVIDAGGHAFEASLPAEPVHLDADLTRLAQVFGNLLTNAAKYTPTPGAIRLTAERAPGGVAVRVRDTGIGIPPDALPRVFDMFAQVDRPIERATGGLGIGLALVKGLVEMHGGTVTAESDGAGAGSTFTVVLPLAPDRPPGPEPAPDRAGAPARGPARRVLVVDDNRDSAASLAAVLGLLGHEVRTAHDGLAAVAAAAAFRPHLILMDVGMPRLNGLDATRRIRAEPWGRDVRIVALTGWGQDGDRARSRAAGCDGHLVKPVEPAALDEVLAAAGRE